MPRFNLASFLCALAAISFPAPSIGQAAAPQTAIDTEPVKVYSAGKDVTAPALLPMDFSVAREGDCNSSASGETEIAFVVDPTGHARDISVLRSGGFDIDRLAAAVVGADRFKPGKLKEVPVPVIQSIKMKLEVCLSTTTDVTGNPSKRWRLTSQPEQHLESPMNTSVTFVAFWNLPTSGPLYRVGNGVSPPVAMNAPVAEYTKEARHAKYQGICLISLMVDARGLPQNARILRPLGMGLDEKALEAVRQYRFRPALLHGKPVPVMITIEINFRL